MAKNKIIWSSKAKLDLLKILEFFYIRNGSKAFSNKVNAKIRRTIRLLSKHPNLGLQTDIDNIRNLVEGDYSIFYQLDKGTIRIITIWDCRQDPSSLIISKL
jgi:plasmid stabilization system protein ParE